jgi:hypothetical protein
MDDYLHYIMLAVGLVLLILKVILFFNFRRKHWNVRHFLYFLKPRNSLSNKHTQVKQIQNFLSIATVFAFAFSLADYYLRN